MLHDHLAGLLALLRVRLWALLTLLLGLSLTLLTLLPLGLLGMLLCLIWSLFVGISHAGLRSHLLWSTLLALWGRLTLIALLRIRVLHRELLGHLMLLLLRLCLLHLLVSKLHLLLQMCRELDRLISTLHALLRLDRKSVV